MTHAPWIINCLFIQLKAAEAIAKAVKQIEFVTTSIQSYLSEFISATLIATLKILKLELELELGLCFGLTSMLNNLEIFRLLLIG